MNSNVLAIVTNYKRPENILQVVRSLAAQSHRVDIVIADNAPAMKGLRPSLPPAEWNELLERVIDIHRWSANCGPPCRFLPAIFAEHEYIFFVDDDIVMQPNAVANLLATAEYLEGKFATIGGIGRRYKRRGNQYSYIARNVPTDPSEPVRCDMTARYHFIRQRDLTAALALRWVIQDSNGDEEVLRGLWVSDDILLCQGIQHQTDHPSYLSPFLIHGSTLKSGKEHAASARTSTFRSDRSALINACSRIGWRSCVS